MNGAAPEAERPGAPSSIPLPEPVPLSVRRPGFLRKKGWDVVRLNAVQWADDRVRGEILKSLEERIAAGGKAGNGAGEAEGGGGDGKAVKPNVM